MSVSGIIPLLGRHKVRYFLVIGSAALVSATEAALHPLLMKAVFDAVSVRENFSDFVWLGLAYLALGIAVNAINHFMSLWKMRVDNRVIADVSESLLLSYYHKSYSDTIRDGDGHYVSRIYADVRDGLTPMLATLRNIIISIVTFAVLISVLVYLSWQAFLVLVFIIPLSAAVSVAVSKRIHNLTDIERDTEASLIDILSRSIRAYKVVNGFSLLHSTVFSYRLSLLKSQSAAYSKFKVVRSLQTAGDLTMVASDSSSVLVGAYMVFNNLMTLGSFIAFMNSFWRSATSLVSIFNMWAELHGYSATVARISAFINEPAIVSRRETGSEVQLRAVRYAYDGASVISNFSLHIALKERVLISGANGSGKTTIANIIAGYLHPSAGAVIIPSRISAITLPLHFPPTIVQDLPISSRLLQAFCLCEPAILNGRPDFLSAGQQQKVALALALSKNADLYILDEPLANLDANARVVALREIRSHTDGKMLVMIMHETARLDDFFDRSVTLATPFESNASASG